MSNGNTDRNSPYYYGTDSTYRPKTVKRPQARTKAPQYTIGLDGVPVLVQTQSQPANSGNRKGAMMGVPNDDSYRTQELDQGQVAENFRTGAGFPGQTPTVPTRDVQKATGSGTQLSPGGKPIVMDMAAADALYKRRGLDSYRSGNKGFINDYNLDPQDSSKYFNPKFTGDFIPKSVAGNMKGYMDDISPTAFSPSTNGQIEGLSIKDSFNNPTKLNTAGMSMSEALADTESMRGPETDEGRLMRARAAFLNTKGSMDGLRAQERELDIIYAGGQHYAADDNGAFIKNSAGFNQAADPEQVKQLKSGQLFKDAFKQNLINSAANTASQAENPYAKSPAPASFYTEPLVDFGSTDILGNNMDMIAGNAFNKTDISPLSDSAFTQDLDVSQYIPGDEREPYMRQLK